ncbi:MAG: hypothetical protein HY784_07805, partial [Chloroflexi bacterium]|nr:hypothetical protein [Chloroflexota bacterium]
PAFEGLNDSEKLQVFLVNEMMILFLLAPLAIPMTIATGRIYELGEGIGENSASKRSFTQANRKCNK